MVVHANIAIGAVQMVLLNAFFTSVTFIATANAQGLNASAAELAEPVVVLAAFAAVVTIILATANILLASLAIGAVHLVAHSTVGTESA